MQVENPDEHIHAAWRHSAYDHDIRVERFDDGTWDTRFNDRLISNHDEPVDAVERAQKLMDG